MKKNLREALVVYLIALLQGMTFSTIPSASQFICAPAGLNLGIANYGLIFIPMVIGAIAASFLSAGLCKRVGLKKILILSLISNILGLSLFASASFLKMALFPCFLMLMTFLGLGFGGMISSLNPLIFYYFPSAASSAITALHAFLGIGTALGPLLFTFSLRIEFWQLDPLIMIILFIAFGWIGHKVIDDSYALSEKISKTPLTKFFLFFAFIAVIYGFIETAFGNWGIIYLFKERSFSYVQASIALSIFWFSVTAGRLVAAFVTLKIGSLWIYRSLPIILAFSLIFMHEVTTPLLLYLVFATAGIGCSCFLPLTISLASTQYQACASKVSGILIALYMSGYAIASEGFAMLQKEYGLSIGSLFFLSIIPVTLLVYMNSVVTIKKSEDL